MTDLLDHGLRAAPGYPGWAGPRTAGPCDGTGAPRSALLMSRLSRRPSTLQLRSLVIDSPDRPVVQILVDGRDAFADQLPGWRGFDPADMLGDRSPLLPDDLGRRVAVCRCSCGTAGCGVIAPSIHPSPDRRLVSWTDFRDYVGVFGGPTAPDGDPAGGRPLPIPDLHFDREQYVAEVRRASADRSWETPRRVTARLVADGLRARGVVLPPDLELRWVEPAWDGDGVTISFEGGGSGRHPFAQRLFTVTSRRTQPEQAARDVLGQLMAAPPDEWPARFGESR